MNKTYRNVIILLLGILFTSYLPSHAGTTLTVSSGLAGLTPDGLLQLIEDIQNVQDETGPAMVNALWLSSIGGYPIGQANLGGFGHFYLGICLPEGMANQKYWDDNYDAPQGYYPAYGPSLVVIAGLGLSENWDILAKFMTFSDRIYKIPLSIGGIELTSYSLYAAGGRLRYRAVSRKVIFPGLLSFGGIALCVGGDFFSGRLGLDGSSTIGLGSIEYNVPPVQLINVEADATYHLKSEWYIASATAEVRAYVDIFWIFSFYTGLGISVGYGTFRVEARGDGTVIETSGPTTLGTITIESNNLYRIKYFLPTYIIGMEINLWLIRLSVESMVDLSNRSDINLQLAARFQF